MLRLDDDWVWDSWPVHVPEDTATPWHLFYLHAPRSLMDPELRHDHASIGHAASADLRSWTVLPEVARVGSSGSSDDHATWTGSVVRAPGGRWHLYYTGTSRSTGPYVQRVLRAVSDDLLAWTKQAGTVVAADPRWYALAGDTEWPDEHWRDPWVFADPGGEGWHMLVTARARPEQRPDLDADDLGVLGHAWSADLVEWQVRAPLSRPGAGFGQLEVPQVVRIHGRWCLVFSCLPRELAGWRRSSGVSCGHWIVPGIDPAGPYDVSGAVPLTDGTLYAGRVVDGPDGPVLLAFDNTWGSDGAGTVVDPVPVPVDGLAYRR